MEILSKKQVQEDYGPLMSTVESLTHVHLEQEDLNFRIAAAFRKLLELLQIKERASLEVAAPPEVYAPVAYERTWREILEQDVSWNRLHDPEKQTLANLQSITLQEASAGRLDQEGFFTISEQNYCDRFAASVSTFRRHLKTLTDNRVVESKDGWEDGKRVVKRRIVIEVLENPRVLNKIISIGHRRAEEAAEKGEWGGSREKKVVVCPDCGRDATETSVITGFCVAGHSFVLDMDGKEHYANLKMPEPEVGELERQATLLLAKSRVAVQSRRTTPRQVENVEGGAIVHSHSTIEKREMSPRPVRDCWPCSYELNQPFQDWQWNGHIWYCGRHQADKKVAGA